MIKVLDLQYTFTLIITVSLLSFTTKFFYCSGIIAFFRYYDIFFSHFYCSAKHIQFISFTSTSKKEYLKAIIVKEIYSKAINRIHGARSSGK